MDAESILQTLQAISLTVAALTAIHGINAWRNEFVGKKRIDLAEEVLVRFYEARDAIKVIRNPFGYVGEGSSRKAAGYETPEEKQLLDNAFVVFERYDKQREVFSHLQSLRYRFMAQFGVDAARSFDDLGRILNDIFIAARMLGQHYWRDQGRKKWSSEEEFQRHLADMDKYEAIFWEMGGENGITADVDEVVRRIEGICDDVIRQEPQHGLSTLIPSKFRRGSRPKADRAIREPLVGKPGGAD